MFEQILMDGCVETWVWWPHLHHPFCLTIKWTIFFFTHVAYTLYSNTQNKEICHTASIIRLLSIVIMASRYLNTLTCFKQVLLTIILYFGTHSFFVIINSSVFLLFRIRSLICFSFTIVSNISRT